jgi:uncharacterized protein YndB with AHSA1/START domain
MQTTANATIKVRATINAPVEKVWEYWTSPEHIVKWNSASPDWCTPQAQNDLRIGGRFKYRMEARDGNMGFDFEGIYTDVKPFEYIAYTIEDGRKVAIHFNQTENGTSIEEYFEAESTHTVEMQQMGWQAILDHFKSYAESSV